MAIRGRKPRDPKPTTTGANAWIEVPDRPFGGPKPPLPREFSPATRLWWKAISAMPHCLLWRPSDWQFALDTARLHDMWIKGHNASITQLTNRERTLGVTFDAVRALRIRYVNPKAFEAIVTAEATEEHGAMADFSAERRRRLLDS